MATSCSCTSLAHLRRNISQCLCITALFCIVISLIDVFLLPLQFFSGPTTYPLLYATCVFHCYSSRSVPHGDNTDVSPQSWRKMCAVEATLAIFAILTSTWIVRREFPLGWGPCPSAGCLEVKAAVQGLEMKEEPSTVILENPNAIYLDGEGYKVARSVQMRAEQLRQAIRRRAWGEFVSVILWSHSLSAADTAVDVEKGDIPSA